MRDDDWTTKGRRAWEDASSGLRSVLNSYSDPERVDFLRGRFSELLAAVWWAHENVEVGRSREAWALRLLVEGFDRARKAQP